MISISKKKLVLNILLFSFLITSFFIFYQTNDVKKMLITLLLTWLCVCLVTIKKDFTGVVFSFFMLSFFTFLLSRITIVTFSGYSPSYTGLLGTAFSNGKTVKDTLFILFLSILFLFVGYSMKIAKKDTKIRIDVVPSFHNVKQVSKLVFLFSFVLRVLVLFEMINTTKSVGYYESFSVFQSSLPSVLVLFSEMYDISLFIFLSCMPKKKECKLFLNLYLLDGFLALLSGRRVEFLLNIIAIIIYISYRHYKNKKEKWINGSLILFLIVVSPILFISLNAIGDIRGGVVTEGTSSILDSVKKFFFSQGISVNVIGYTLEYLDSLPKQNYSFGPIIEFFKTKILDVFFGSDYFLVGQTVQRAMEGNLYSHTISYYIMPDLYLKGIGYGSSYVAELFKDFSLFGVVAGNFFYGLLFKNAFTLLDKGTPFFKGVVFLMIRQVMFAPRSSFSNFLVSSVSIPKLFAIVVILFVSQTLIQTSEKGMSDLEK